MEIIKKYKCMDQIIVWRKKSIQIFYKEVHSCIHIQEYAGIFTYVCMHKCERVGFLRFEGEYVCPIIGVYGERITRLGSCSVAICLC